jgi:hypothetical protein
LTANQKQSLLTCGKQFFTGCFKQGRFDLLEFPGWLVLGEGRRPGFCHGTTAFTYVQDIQSLTLRGMFGSSVVVSRNVLFAVDDGAAFDILHALPILGGPQVRTKTAAFLNAAVLRFHRSRNAFTTLSAT